MTNFGNVQLIAAFASLKCQVRYLIHPTGKYLMIDCMYNDYWPENVNMSLPFYIKEGSLTPDEAEDVRSFNEVLIKEYQQLDNQEPYTVMVLKNPSWARIREAAKQCLKKLKFDLKRWEDENVDPLPVDSPYLKIVEEEEV
ncbi:MAG: hypothetical protein HY461_01880 [Parcubacteria group bacterium]|nr:hypothetical protein [Parcubacteria group bacterium]